METKLIENLVKTLEVLNQELIRLHFLAEGDHWGYRKGRDMAREEIKKLNNFLIQLLQ